MITTFKILHGMIDTDSKVFLNDVLQLRDDTIGSFSSLLHRRA